MDEGEPLIPLVFDQANARTFGKAFEFIVDNPHLLLTKALEQLATIPRHGSAQLIDSHERGHELSFAPNSGLFQQVIWLPETAEPLLAGVERFTRHPGLNAAYIGDADDTFEQSQRILDPRGDRPVAGGQFAVFDELAGLRGAAKPSNAGIGRVDDGDLAATGQAFQEPPGLFFCLIQPRLALDFVVHAQAGIEDQHDAERTAQGGDAGKIRSQWPGQSQGDEQDHQDAEQK